ncbi:hypothetical protein HK104_002716 [Borealophlyctis nickersoniae]|nr:hypothetical protein HK104_002716 [Borealophlyctis nickersoniae]
MGKGKVAAQCCHATLAAYKSALASGDQVKAGAALWAGILGQSSYVLVMRTFQKQAKEWLKSWEVNGQAKITLKCPSLDALLVLWSWVCAGLAKGGMSTRDLIAFLAEKR